ncbi:BREX system P-loop protein BrxC [Aquirufa sp. ROCK2-A2]
MKLKEIFARDINRDINPAVVVSAKDPKTIEAEIKEYVFTPEIIEKLFTIIDTVINKKSGKSGIWINGYYGSGKSHFIKFVHYLMNRNTSADAFEALENGVNENYDTTKPNTNDKITISNLRLLKKKITDAQCDDIMFNVEDETDDGSQERLTRIFLNMFNKFRGYNSNDIPLAILLEKTIDQKGKFDEFKRLIDSELGFNWETDSAQVASFQLESVLEIAKKVCPDLDIVSLHSKLSNPESYKVGINAVLIPEFKEYLKGKDKDYRLLFLVDEVSQYVGSNKEILLNFQNIIERISEDCNNQVWIACTAQQTLDDVSLGADGVQDVQDEFGKILGRFDTRISLQSNDASYITQRRVLDKNSTGIAELTKIYSANKDYIENQFKISHELYKGYKNEEEFLFGYPFVPYQFKLVAHVFEAFQQLKFVIKEVKDNERSVLGITHFTAKQHADDQVGGFIPFDGFYNQQFHANLTNRGAKAIENGLELAYVKSNPFAARVVKVLFMISNLLENRRQTFPSTVDNLTVLLMDKLDQNKMQLQKEITDVLTKLIEGSIIREEKGSYFFFNEDEMDVQNIIKNQTIGLDDRLTAFDEFLRPLIKLKPKVAFGQNDFNLSYNIESKEFLRGGDFNLVILLTDKTPLTQKMLDVNTKDLVICINEWYNNDSVLRQDFEWYCKTNKYLINGSGGATGERAKTNENFKIRNKQLSESISRVIELKFIESRFISQNTILEADQINGNNPSERVKNLIEHHLNNIYKYHKLSYGYARNQIELKASAASTQIEMAQLSPAEQSVNDFITSNNNQITITDLIKQYGDAPFGWRFEAVLEVALKLVKKKKREFKYKGAPRYPIVDFINKAVSTAERMSCEIVTGEDIDQVLLDDVVSAFKYIFNETISTSSDGNEMFETLSKLLSTKIQQIQPFEKEYFGKYPFGGSFQKSKQQLTTWTDVRDPKRLFQDFIASKDSAKELFDTEKGIEDFINNNFKDYTALSSFCENNKENFKEFSAENQTKAKTITDFLLLEDPRKDFRHAKKAYEELNQALKDLTAELKKEVKSIYISIFDELEQEAIKLNVSAAVFESRDTVLNAIDSINSIAQLKNKKLNASNFKSDQLEKIIASIPVPPGGSGSISAPYHISKGVSTISNEAEMEDFLQKVKSDMLKLLKDNKTIILK